jgi:hypothetical protein
MYSKPPRTFLLSKILHRNYYNIPYNSIFDWEVTSVRQAFRVAVLCAGMIAIVVLVFAAMHGKGLRVAAASQAPPVTSASEPKSQRLFCGLWRLDGGFASTAHIKNLLLTGPLAVSPVIYMADGTEYALPTVTIDPSGLADVSVGDALNNASPKIRAHISQFGSMALTFTSASAVNVVAGVEILNLEQSLIFVAPFQAVGAMGHGAMPAGDHILDAVWWKHDTGVKAFVALSNASDSPKVVSVEVSGSEGSLRRTDATVRPKNTNMIDVEQLIADLPEAERSTGGIRVRYSGQMSEIRATAGLMNDSEGYSANVEFQPHSANTSGPIAMSYASVGIMAGLPDPRMGFPKGSTFSPYAAIRNPTNHPLDAAPVLYLMAGSTVKKTFTAGPASRSRRSQATSTLAAAIQFQWVGDARHVLCRQRARSTYRHGQCGPDRDIRVHGSSGLGDRVLGKVRSVLECDRRFRCHDERFQPWRHTGRHCGELDVRGRFRPLRSATSLGAR